MAAVRELCGPERRAHRRLELEELENVVATFLKNVATFCIIFRKIIKETKISLKFCNIYKMLVQKCVATFCKMLTKHF
jgi:IS30 family transposase